MLWSEITRAACVCMSGSSSGISLLPPKALGALTFLPIHLLTGFMRKEEKKPLRYITSGMVAMNFCGAEWVGIGVSGGAAWAWGPWPWAGPTLPSSPWAD